MPGDANAAERGWLRALIAGLVFTQMLSPARDAAGGQSQSQIPVSAYVVVSSTIAATLSAPSIPAPSAAPASPPASADAPAARQAAPASQTPRETPQICTQVAVSCSGRTRMRVSVEGGESSDNVQECAAPNTPGAQNTVSLCAAGANGPQGSLGLNIEY